MNQKFNEIVRQSKIKIARYNRMTAEEMLREGEDALYRMAIVKMSEKVKLPPNQTPADAINFLKQQILFLEKNPVIAFPIAKLRDEMTLKAINDLIDALE